MGQTSMKHLLRWEPLQCCLLCCSTRDIWHAQCLPLYLPFHMRREGNLEQAASFTSTAWEDSGSNPALHARDVLSEQYAPLVYHSGYKLAGTTQISASRAFVFAGSCSAAMSDA